MSDFKPKQHLTDIEDLIDTKSRELTELLTQANSQYLLVVSSPNKIGDCGIAFNFNPKNIKQEQAEAFLNNLSGAIEDMTEGVLTIGLKSEEANE